MKFTLTQGLDNDSVIFLSLLDPESGEFIDLYDAANSTYSISVHMYKSSGEEVSPLNVVMENALPPTGTEDVFFIISNSGRIKLTFKKAFIDGLEKSAIGEDIDSYYMKPNYKIFLECSGFSNVPDTMSDGFTIKIDKVYIE